MYDTVEFRLEFTLLISTYIYVIGSGHTMVKMTATVPFTVTLRSMRHQSHCSHVASDLMLLLSDVEIIFTLCCVSLLSSEFCSWVWCYCLGFFLNTQAQVRLHDQPTFTSLHYILLLEWCHYLLSFHPLLSYCHYHGSHYHGGGVHGTAGTAVAMVVKYK